MSEMEAGHWVAASWRIRALEAEAERDQLREERDKQTDAYRAALKRHHGDLDEFFVCDVCHPLFADPTGEARKG